MVNTSSFHPWKVRFDFDLISTNFVQLIVFSVFTCFLAIFWNLASLIFVIELVTSTLEVAEGLVMIRFVFGKFKMSSPLNNSAFSTYFMFLRFAFLLVNLWSTFFVPCRAIY